MISLRSISHKEFAIKYIITMDSDINKRYTFNVSNQYIFKYIISHFERNNKYCEDNLKLKETCLFANEHLFSKEEENNIWYCKSLHTD